MEENVKRMVLYLERHSKIGICQRSLVVTEIKSASRTEFEGESFGRLHLAVPYCEQSLDWEVIFNCENLNFPPDFIFHDDDFSPDVSHFQIFESWNLDDERSLVIIIDSLLTLYREYAASTLPEGSRIQTEYLSLLSHPTIKNEDIETYLSNNSLMLVKLPLEVSNSQLTEHLNVLIFASLLVSFSSTYNSIISTSLVLSTSLELSLGKNFKKPAKSHNPISVLSEVTHVTDAMNKKIGIVSQCFRMRKTLVFGFLETFSNSILEYDAVDYSYICVMAFTKNNIRLVHVNIPRLFPDQHPSIEFQQIDPSSNSMKSWSLDVLNARLLHRTLEPETYADRLMRFLKADRQ